MLGNPAFAAVVKALYECFKHLKDGGALEDLANEHASADLLRAVNRTEEFLQSPRSVGYANWVFGVANP